MSAYSLHETRGAVGQEDVSINFRFDMIGLRGLILILGSGSVTVSQILWDLSEMEM